MSDMSEPLAAALERNAADLAERQARWDAASNDIRSLERELGRIGVWAESCILLRDDERGRELLWWTPWGSEGNYRLVITSDMEVGPTAYCETSRRLLIDTPGEVRARVAPRLPELVDAIARANRREGQ